MNPTDPYIARLTEVARAYYQENQTQAEIARALGISRSMVSRYLLAARGLGIVQIKIAATSETSQQLVENLRRKYSHLREVIVAPTFSLEADAQRTMIGRFAANYLVDALRPQQVLTLGCGRTLRAMVDALQKPEASQVVVVQAMGSVGHEAHQIDYNEIARRAAETLGGEVYYISAPAILGVGSGRAQSLISANHSLRHAVSLARKADIYVVGLGSLESDQLYARAGLLQQRELDDLKHRYAVGDICGRFFDADGHEVVSGFFDRVVGIELNDLRSAQLAIGVAGGADKAAPLLGAIRGGFLSVVITDEATLEAVLKLDQPGA